MALYSASVEYGLHCLLYLADGGSHASSQDLAALQGVSPSYVAKLFASLGRAGLVEALEGVGGGYRLARAARDISVLDVVTALEGDKPLFQCKNIRTQCALFERGTPRWASQGVCGIHAVMLEAERGMREVLASHSLADIATRLARKAPKTFPVQIAAWLTARKAGRARQSDRSRPSGVKQ